MSVFDRVGSACACAHFSIRILSILSRVYSGGRKLLLPRSPFISCVLLWVGRCAATVAPQGLFPCSSLASCFLFVVSFVCGVNKATPPTLFRITLNEVILNPNLLSCLSPHLKDDTFSRGLSYMKSDSDELES